MPYKNILLIDDDYEDRDIFSEALSIAATDLSCTGIGSCKEALQKLEAKELTPDLIILDLNMPVMTGQQFLVEIKKSEALKDIPVIVFSTSSNATTIALTRELGAAGFYTKPQKFNEIVDIIRLFI